QLYCKNPNGVTLTLKGKLPTTPYRLNLLPEWHLLPAIAVDGPKPLSWLLQGVTYDIIWRFNPTTQQLETPTDILPGESYFVHVLTTSLFSPPPPRDQTTTFVYDGDGGKVKQVTAAGTTISLGDQVEIAPDGTVTNYVFAGSLRVAALDSTGALRFYHPDHLGSSNVVTDATGALVELNEHTPYGSLRRHEGPADVRHKFTGQHQDAGTGLVLFPARAYDPTLGRFLQPDPFVQDPADPQTLNRYSYVRNNPLNLVDPSGYGWVRWIARVVGAVIGAIVGFFVCGPECAYTGAVIGFGIGDSVGTALERRSGSSSRGSFPIAAASFSDAAVAAPGTQSASPSIAITGSPLGSVSQADDLDQITAALTESLGISDQAAAHVASECVPEAGSGVFLDLLLFGGGLAGMKTAAVAAKRG
ncbi:MAG: RHS repeat-associated core domain-containing protein, partial [Chloroflexota bacterium]